MALSSIKKGKSAEMNTSLTGTDTRKTEGVIVSSLPRRPPKDFQPSEKFHTQIFKMFNEELQKGYCQRLETSGLKSKS